MPADNRSALETVMRGAFNVELVDRGFARVGRRKVWLRQRIGIAHAVSVEASHGSWKTRWDLVHPAEGEILWGKTCDVANVAYATIMVGTPSRSIGHGLEGQFTAEMLAEEARQGTVESVRAGVAQVAWWLDDFPSAEEVVSFLTCEATEADRRMTVPSGRAMRTLVAAALAASENVDGAADLVDRYIMLSAPWAGGLTDERIARLKDALKT